MSSDISPENFGFHFRFRVSGLFWMLCLRKYAYMLLFMIVGMLLWSILSLQVVVLSSSEKTTAFRPFLAGIGKEPICRAGCC